MMAGRTLKSAAMALGFLLVGLVAVAADTQLASEDMMKGINRGMLTTTSTDACPTELAACNADTSCIVCGNEFLAAADGCGLYDSGSCDDAQEAYCCALADEDEDCENDTTFSSYIECLWQDLVDGGNGCEDADVDLSDCNGATGRSSSWGLSIAMCATAAAGLLVTAFGLVV